MILCEFLLKQCCSTLGHVSHVKEIIDLSGTHLQQQQKKPHHTHDTLHTHASGHYIMYSFLANVKKMQCFTRVVSFSLQNFLTILNGKYGNSNSSSVLPLSWIQKVKFSFLSFPFFCIYIRKKWPVTDLAHMPKASWVPTEERETARFVPLLHSQHFPDLTHTNTYKESYLQHSVYI